MNTFPTPGAMLLTLAIGLACCSAWAADHGGESKPEAEKKATAAEPPAATAKEMGDKVREALGVSPGSSKKLTLVINGKPVATAADASHGAGNSKTSKGGAKGKKEAQGHEVHWAYEGDNGPQAWGSLKPEFNACAIGKRQSPINIEDGNALSGPAEPVQFEYAASNGTVLNNGHTIQVNVNGENSITVRGSTYKLLQFHFHTPSEEQINGRRYPMVAHLVHKNEAGQLAVVAVLLELGSPSTLVDKVWTYMPLDTGDKVNMPENLLDMKELLPSDQRYYQFMGSLTTPPCTEGVLWIVLKQAMKISKTQHKLFTQLYPNNARPVQPLNGRPVRDAQ